jgi:hypothetical protein
MLFYSRGALFLPASILINFWTILPLPDCLYSYRAYLCVHLFILLYSCGQLPLPAFLNSTLFPGESYPLPTCIHYTLFLWSPTPVCLPLLYCTLFLLNPSPPQACPHSTLFLWSPNPTCLPPLYSVPVKPCPYLPPLYSIPVEPYPCLPASILLYSCGALSLPACLHSTLFL